MSEPSVSLGVEVTLIASNHGGTGPFTYIWKLDGTDIVAPDLEGNQLKLGRVELADAGDYTVLVKNAEGEALSAPFRLQVDPTFVNISIPTGGEVYGAEWVDIDNDGWPDLSAVVNKPGDLGVSWRVLRNSRDGALKLVWERGFIDSDYMKFYFRGYGDYDNDGLPDAAVGGDNAQLYLCHNVGGAQLKWVWQGPPLYYHCEWADLDGDGYLDMVQPNPWGTTQVYLNDHNGPPFRVSGKPSDPGWALTKVRESHYAAWGDYDDDGLLDVYVTGYTVPGELFRNLGAGNFAVTDFRGPASVSWDAEWVDYDNDNDLDLVISFWFERLLEVYRNDGGGQFVLMTEAEIGDLATDFTPHSVAIAWGDYDNDGDLDLYRVAGDGGWLDWQIAPGRFYVNQGDGRFRRVVAGSPTTGKYGYPYTACWADYDNDGFLDLIGGRAPENGSPIYRNNLPQAGNANHWLKVQCEGRVSNRDAVGTKVRVKATMAGKERRLLRQIVRPGCGGVLTAHFGLGDATKVDVLRIEWPSGAVQEYKDVGIDQSLVIREPPRLVATGPCEFQVKCWPGMHFAVEASLDLKTWSAVGSVTNVNGSATFADPAGAQGTCRFFRVVDE